MRRRPTRLCIFDFDGTLCHSPVRPAILPPSCGWDGKGDWWQHPLSLTPRNQGGFWDGGMVHEVVRAYHDAAARQDTRAILLTGRTGEMARQVHNALAACGLGGRRRTDCYNLANFDEFYKGDIDCGVATPSTLDHKRFVIAKSCELAQGYEEVELWDDRVPHAEAFALFGHDCVAQGNCTRFTLVQVAATVSGVSFGRLQVPHPQQTA